MKALIFAAGLGTRLKPFTDIHPKALAFVNGKTLLQRNIEYLKAAGIYEMVINIHHFGNQIVDFLQQHANFGCRIEISDETDEVLETGGGLLKARPFLEGDDFVVLNVDILTQMDLTQMLAFHQTHLPLVTLAVSDRDSSRKLMFDHNMRLCGWKNFVTGEEIITQTQVYKVSAFSGIHIMRKDIFDYIDERGKFSIMKSYMRLMSGQILLGYDHSGDILIDVGKPEAIAQAAVYFK
ncbi:MAG: nucleotidyltransferase family protein [Flavobacteriaceae bacterium]|nr:nucleotidyltransferase family protein [Flavobacteriaceae bacterium]